MRRGSVWNYTIGGLSSIAKIIGSPSLHLLCFIVGLCCSSRAEWQIRYSNLSAISVAMTRSLLPVYTDSHPYKVSIGVVIAQTFGPPCGLRLHALCPLLHAVYSCDRPSLICTAVITRDDIVKMPSPYQDVLAMADPSMPSSVPRSSL